MTDLPQPHLDNCIGPPESESAPIAACLGPPVQCWQRAKRAYLLTEALSVRDKEPTPFTDSLLMETKTQTIHTITTGRVEISGGRIEATCQTSGDTVTLELPYGVVTEAVEKFVTDRLGRWDRDRFLTMLTDLNRAEDAKAEASK